MSRRDSRKRAAPHPSLTGWRGAAKRSFDVAASSLGLALGLPLLVAVGVLVAVTSRGPVLFRQRRLGHEGRVFTMIKFRTMAVDAESDGKPVWAITDDPRSTRVGAVLRRYRIDELPQLWNVLRGDMSMVGPRPERPEFAREFARRWPGYDNRLAVRAGLTGLAQVEGWRGDSSLKERLACDERYIAGWSLTRDFVILLRTIPELLLQRRERGEERITARESA